MPSDTMRRFRLPRLLLLRPGIRLAFRVFFHDTVKQCLLDKLVSLAAVRLFLQRFKKPAVNVLSEIESQ